MTGQCWDSPGTLNLNQRALADARPTGKFIEGYSGESAADAAGEASRSREDADR